MIHPPRNKKHEIQTDGQDWFGKGHIVTNMVLFSTKANIFRDKKHNIFRDFRKETSA
jgi:hypothetical protein